MKIIIKDLESKYKINILKVVELYKVGGSRSKIVKEMKSSDMVIRTILLRLNLRMGSKFREIDYYRFKQALEGSADINEEISTELKESLNLLEQQNSKILNLQTKLRLQNKMLKSLYERENSFVRDFDIEPYKFSFKKASKGEKDGILVLSDIHYGEMINLPFNTYNPEIARDYLEYIFQKVVDNKFTTLNLFLVGDLINGLIHDLDGDTITPPQQAIELANILGELLLKLNIPIRISMVNGNHSRLKENVPNKNKAFDYEYIIFEFLKAKGFDITYSEIGYLVTEVNTHKFGLFHGDTVRSYAVDNNNETLKVEQIFKKYCGKEIKSIISGHTHTFRVSSNILGGINLVNGCISGSNDYGLNNGFYPLHNKEQTLLKIDKNGDLEILPIFI